MFRGAGGGGVVLHGAKLLRTSDQLVQPGVATAVSFDTEKFDSDGYHAPGQPTRLTIPAGLAGVYLVGGGFELEANTDTRPMGMILQLNGATPLAITRSGPFTAGLDTPEGMVATLWNAAVGDFFELICLHNGAAARNVKHFVGNELPEFWCTKVG